MKAILLVTAVLARALASGAAHAAFDPANHTCAAMQSVLASTGEIEIARAFGTTTYYAQPNCNGGQTARTHYEWAEDTSACRLGWDCISSGGGGGQ